MSSLDDYSPSWVRRNLVVLSLAVPGIVSGVGCAPRAGARPPAAHAERAAPPAAQVSDDAFADAVHDLLVSDPGSAERAVRLGAVEARQMARAEARFKAREPDRAIAAVSGGIYLV